MEFLSHKYIILVDFFKLFLDLTLHIGEGATVLSERPDTSRSTANYYGDRISRATGLWRFFSRVAEQDLHHRGPLLLVNMSPCVF